MTNLTGTWKWTIHTTEYTYDFKGQIKWTSAKTEGNVATLTGIRYECYGTAPCTENGTATLTYDGKQLLLSMTATQQNCPPFPGEPCESVSGIWSEGEDSDGQIGHTGKTLLIKGTTNVYTRKPEVGVNFELQSDE